MNKTISEICSLLIKLKNYGNVYQSIIGEGTSNLDPNCIKILKIDIPNLLKGFFPEDHYLIKGSVGTGRVASTPWIAILDSRVTKSTQQGVYLVILFSKDLKKAYFSLGQGVTESTTDEITEMRESIRNSLSVKSEYLKCVNDIDIENKEYKNSVIYSNELKCDDPEFNNNLLIELKDVYIKYVKQNSNIPISEETHPSISENIDILEHEAYSKILHKRQIEKPILPLVEMELTEQEIEGLKKDIIEFEKVNHLETCGREIAMCFAYWFQHEYSGGIDTKRAEEVAVFIGLKKEESTLIVDYGLNALKAWGVVISLSNKGKQRKVGTLLEQGGTPINYVLQLVKNKENNRQETPKQIVKRRDDDAEISKEERDTNQTRINYIGFLTSLLREAPNYSTNWDKALKNAPDIIYQIEANDLIPNSLKTPFLCRQYITIIRGIVEDNKDLLKTLDKNLKDLVEKLREIYYETNKEVKELALRWKLMILQGQIYQYYSLINYNLIDPEKYNFETNNCNSFELIVGDNRFQYMKGKVNGKIVYRYRPQPTVNTDVYYDGKQPYVQAHILLGGKLYPIKLKNDTPINFDIPQILKESSGYYIPSTIMSDLFNVVVFNDEWKYDGVNSETVLYNNEEFNLIRFSNDVKRNDIKLTNKDGESFMFEKTNTDYNIEIKGSDFEHFNSPKYILTQNGPTINVNDANGNNVINNCNIAYRIHQSYNDKWKTKEEWGELPLGFIDVKIELPDQIQKSFTFYEIGNLMPNYVKADGDTTIIEWNTQDYQNSSVFIEETDSEYFQINKQTGNPIKWTIVRKKGVAYRPSCTFHLKANHVSPVIDIKVKTLFKANFITETIDGKQYELENGKVLSYDNLSNYSILVTNDNKEDVEMAISYISNNNVLETKSYVVKCDNTIHQLSDYRDAIDDLIKNRSHLYGLITTDRKLEIKIGDNRTYYLSRYQYKIDIADQTVKLSPHPNKPCHLYAIPLIDPDDDCVQTDEISPFELDQDNGQFILPNGKQRHKFLIYSSKQDHERAIPKLLDMTQDLDSCQRSELKVKNIDAWANALIDEKCTERGGIWDRCSRYFILAKEQSIHFSAFNCINAVTSNDFLLAKFIVHMIIVDNGNSQIIRYLRCLEQEFIFSACWISKTSWKKVIREVLLELMPGTKLEKDQIKILRLEDITCDDIENVKKRRDDYTQKWQPAIHEIRRALFDNIRGIGLDVFAQMLAPKKGDTILKKLCGHPRFERNKRKVSEWAHIPSRSDVQFNLENDYDKELNQVRPNVKQYLMAAMYLAEVLYGMHDEIWKDKNYRLRKLILNCQNYDSEIFSEIVIDTMRTILNYK